MTSEPPLIQELFGEEIRHCTVPFSPFEPSAFTNIETLPYYNLGGPGLERLCFEILLAQQYQPRFFGRSGQRQYGIDLLAEKEGETLLLQSKNHATPPSAHNLEEYLQTFEREWLNEAKLRKPDKFVICSPHLLRDSETEFAWNAARDAFRKRTGVEAALWHLDLLNGWLKKLPDVVADLFSNCHAEAFCNIDGWKQDLFIPLHECASGDPRLRRYFERRRSGRLFLDQDYEAEITDAMECSSVILVRGLPGTGKTFTSLAVAEGFRAGRWRTYFLDVGDDEFIKAQMKEGIRRRILSRPSIFVLENCHEKLDDIEKALGDLEQELRSGNLKIVCLTRRVPGPHDSRSDDSVLVAELESRNVVVEFENNERRLKRVVEFWQPAFKGLSNKRLARLNSLCGNDLLLLDEVLRLIESPAEIDTLSPAEMYDRVRCEYFENKTADDLQATRRLAALAQFDIRPRADVLTLPEEELRLIGSFCVRTGRPPCWHFLHSTAAELVLHVLWSGMGVTEPAKVAGYAAKDVIDYFTAIQSNHLRPTATPVDMETDLLGVVRNRLKLAGEDGENLLKAAVLDSEPVRTLITKLVALPTYLRTISWSALVAHRTGAASAHAYGPQLCDALKDVLRTTEATLPAGVLPVFGICLRALRLVNPTLHADLTREFDTQHLVRLIEANGTVFELFSIIQNASPVLAKGLIAALDEARVDTLIAKTIAAGRSIGTLNFTLRKLRCHEETQALGEDLERRIGPACFWRLLVGAGSPGPLVDLMRDISPDFRRQVLAASHDLSQGQWAQMVRRGDFFQLCELISDCPVVFKNDAGGLKLLAVVEAEAPPLVAGSDWHARNTGAKSLAKCPETQERDAAALALDGWLSLVKLEELSFASLNEAINGLELLYDRRPDVRAALPSRLWTLLPPPERWRFDPKKDMALPKLLLRLVAKPEFSRGDVERVMGSLVQRLTPELIAMCRTVDTLWTVWALFALAHQRNGLTPAAFARSLPSEFMRSLHESLASVVGQKGDRDEWRARFALIGLLALFESPLDSATVAALGKGLLQRESVSVGAWWLCADQTFVTAYLVLRGVEMAVPFPGRLKRHFLGRLVGAAAAYPEMDSAAEYLLRDVIH